MRVAICDDILSDRQRLVEYIRRYIGENCIDDLELREYDCAEALLADKTMPDVLFLDIYMTMAEAEALLLSYKNFIRCHRSYIINLNEVENVTDTTVLLTNGDRVLLNSKNAASLRRQIADFIWKGMDERLE